MRYNNLAYGDFIWACSITCCKLCERYLCCGKIDKQVVGNSNVISANAHRATRVNLCAYDIYTLKLCQWTSWDVAKVAAYLPRIPTTVKGYTAGCPTTNVGANAATKRQNESNIPRQSKKD
jgi:hypothetical protein